MLVLASPIAHAQNWPSFRPTGGLAVGDRVTPTSWDVPKSVNVAWKTAIPGIALSSPIVWQDRIYLTTAVPQQGPRGDDYRTPHIWKLMSFDRNSGKLLWETPSHQGTPHMQRHPRSSYANSTPATDGRHIVALFGTDALACFDAKGTLLWKKVINQQGVGPQSGHFGSSPLIVEDLAVLLNDRESDSYLAAYRLQDGAEVWKLARNEGQAQSTPAVAWTNSPGGRRALLIVAGPRSLRALDPKTGTQVWGMELSAEFSVATPTVVDDVVIYGGWGSNKPIHAVRAGARGTFTPGDTASVAWSTQRGGFEIPSPLAADGLLYVLSGNGILSAYDVRDGKQIYQQRAATGEFFASPVMSGNKIYIMNTEGDVTVVRAGRSFEVLARNSMSEPTSATPAIIDGVMYVRTAGYLLALREASSRSGFRPLP